MPRKPKRPCSFPGCPELTDGRYCDMHQRQVDAFTTNTNEIPKQENAMAGDGNASGTDISQSIRFARSAKSTEGLHQPKRYIILSLYPKAEPMQTITL